METTEGLHLESAGKELHRSRNDYKQRKKVIKNTSPQLVDNGLVTDQLTLTVGYDIDNLKDNKIGSGYSGEVTMDRYGRAVPKHAHGTANLDDYTASTKRIIAAVLELFDRITDKNLLVRRIYLTANRVVEEGTAPDKHPMEQLDLFTDYDAQSKLQTEEKAAMERERRMQRTMLDIKKRFGKNAILKGMNLEEGATTNSRNGQIGGHKA